MYFFMNHIHGSLFSVSEPMYKNLLNSALHPTNLYIFVLAVKAIINQLMYTCMYGIAYLAPINL